MNEIFDARRTSELFRAGLRAAALASFASGCGGSDDAPANGSNGNACSAPKVVPYAPTPDADEFYKAPDPLPDVPAGTVLNSRSVVFKISGAELPNPAWQLQFLSADADGCPQAAITTVVKPLVESATRPVALLSYQFAEDSLGNRCAPSHQATGATDQPTSQLELSLTRPGLETHGWAVMYPDHEGPYSAYAVGAIAAHVTLDAIRAAESFQELGLAGNDTPVLMWGYSGGALATAWAAQMQPDYAPELNIIGVASGGTPTDLTAAAKAFDSGPGNALFSLGFSATIGVARAYPSMLPEDALNDKGRAAVESLKDGCVGLTTDGTPAPTGRFADYVTAPDPFDTPGVRQTAPKINLPQPGAVPRADMYVYHAIADQLIPVAGIDATVQAYCDAGARIHYNRIATGEHIAVAATGAGDALSYLVSRTAGGEPNLPLGTVTCN
jgi:hypothetical protein